MNLSSLLRFNEHLETVKDDTLEKLDEIVDFESFREMITERLDYEHNPRGEHPPFDPVVMFKILILQSMHNLSDAKTGYMVRDRLSWVVF